MHITIGNTDSDSFIGDVEQVLQNMTAGITAVKESEDVWRDERSMIVETAGLASMWVGWCDLDCRNVVVHAMAKISHFTISHQKETY